MALHDWAEKSKKIGGQMKIEKVLKENKLEEFKKFVDKF